uniref:Oxidoreductase FAD/NAD(P)-binding domain-containing protein n=1 Tax=Phaeomonas parva TaxID=124430 RepID=A0A7S1TNG0_9STRA|mmetsp:Transcript_1033/g.2846  ORF Transcript_1033/g.2846 Transcript_1033/m.2846 type:complete len:271 (+) Transcript_1033:391-1203(+)
MRRSLRRLCAAGEAELYIPHKLLSKEPASASGGAQLLRFAWPEGERGLASAPSSVYYAQGPDFKPKKSYSPISLRHEPTMDIVVKAYAPAPDGAGYGAALCGLSIGETAALRYKPGKDIKGLGGVKRLGLLAAGTGMAPLLQIARDALRRDDGLASISLLSSYQKRDDVLLGPYLTALEKESNGIFRHRNVITGDGDRIDAAAISAAMPPPGTEDALILVCGTDGFVAGMGGPLVREVDAATGKRGPKRQGPLEGVLSDLGYAAEEVYKF